MMKILIAAVGKLRSGPEQALLQTYLDRAEAAGRQLGFGPFEVAELTEARASTPELRKSSEAAALKSRLQACDAVVALEPKGRALSSEEFAVLLRDLRDRGSGQLGFVIGGADGLAPEIGGEASLKLSLGALTLPHGLARIVLAEQLYRAMTILAGHPYHRD